MSTFALLLADFFASFAEAYQKARAARAQRDAVIEAELVKKADADVDHIAAEAVKKSSGGAGGSSAPPSVN